MKKDAFIFLDLKHQQGLLKVVMTGNSYWDQKTIFHGALRPKENFIKPEMAPDIGKNESESQSKYEKIRSMINGLMNDKDGSYTKQLLAENQDIVDKFNKRVQEGLAQQTPSFSNQETQIAQQETEYQGYSRS